MISNETLLRSNLKVENQIETINYGNHKQNEIVMTNRFDQINKEANVLKFSEFQNSSMPKITEDYFSN